MADNALSLYLKTMNFHGLVSGPHFWGYHLMPDEQASGVLDAIEPLAERVRALASQEGNPFWNPELASAEDQCARRARIWLTTGKSSVGSQHRGVHELTRLAFGLCCFQFFLCQAASSANVESQTGSFNR